MSVSNLLMNMLSPLCNRGDVAQRQRGHLLSVLVFLIISLTACATPSQMYWDHKVKELCEKDGGVTVYEKVELTKDEYEKLGGYNGYVRSPEEKYAKSYDLFISRSKMTEIESGSPRIYRHEINIFRRSDMKLLGIEISYGRIGGDISTGISHESSFSCGDIKGFNANINKIIFSVKGV